MPAALRLLGANPGGDDLGVGEADRRYAALVPASAGTRRDLGDHLALRHRPVRQHGLAGHVADGEDAAHGGAALVVDAEVRAVAVEVELLEPPAFDGGPAADGDEDLVGLEPHFVAVRRLDRERRAAGGEAPRLGAGQDA